MTSRDLLKDNQYSPFPLAQCCGAKPEKAMPGSAGHE